MPVRQQEIASTVTNAVLPQLADATFSKTDASIS